MKLSRLYSSKPDLFEPVEFVQGLNVVMAEIRLPENRNRDTHNLGKTTLGRLLDFAFLAKRDPKFFLFKHVELFKDFIFFLEIELEDASFVTIRRGVEEATKIMLEVHHKGAGTCGVFSKQDARMCRSSRFRRRCAARWPRATAFPDTTVWMQRWPRILLAGRFPRR